MGKKAKEHRKKVQLRNDRIKVEQKKLQKLYQQMYEQKMAELQAQVEKSKDEEVVNEVGE